MAEQLTHNNVSTRLVLGGHSFSGVYVERHGSVDARSEAIVATAQTVLVPYALFCQNEAAVIADAGLVIRDGECAVFSEPKDDIVAVMVIGCDMLDEARQRGCMSWTSPLLLDCPTERGTVLSLANGVLFVRIYDDGLQLAEAVEVQGESDVIYYLEQINAAYHIYNIGVCLQLGAEQLKNVCKRLFKHVVCE